MYWFKILKHTCAFLEKMSGSDIITLDKMNKTEHEPLTTDEILSNAYGDYCKDVLEITKNILSKVNEDNREKARVFLDDYLHNGPVHTSVYDFEECFSDMTEIEYLEFNSADEAEDYFSNKDKITKIIVVISEGDEELTMIEISNIIAKIKRQEPETLEILFNTVSKAPAGFLRVLR